MKIVKYVINANNNQKSNSQYVSGGFIQSTSFWQFGFVSCYFDKIYGIYGISYTIYSISYILILKE